MAVDHAAVCEYISESDDREAGDGRGGRRGDGTPGWIPRPPRGVLRGSPEGKGGCVPGGSIAGRLSIWVCVPPRLSVAPSAPQIRPPKETVACLTGRRIEGRSMGPPRGALVRDCWRGKGQRGGVERAWCPIRQRNRCGSAANTRWGIPPSPGIRGPNQRSHADTIPLVGLTPTTRRQPASEGGWRYASRLSEARRVTTPPESQRPPR